jgi:adenylate cyclase
MGIGMAHGTTHGITMLGWSDYVGLIRCRAVPTHQLEARLEHGLGWAVALWALHLALLQSQGWVVGWLLPAITVFVASLAWGILEHTKSRIDRDRLYTHLSSYLPAPVAAALALQPPSSAIKASTRMVSVMFADIRNFSAYCEARPPQEAAAVLHAFFSIATRVVEANNGVIEAFQGDAVLAVWYGEDYEVVQETQGILSEKQSGIQSGLNGFSSKGAQRSMKAASELYLAMQGSLPDPAPAGLEPLALGVGLECGPAMAGSFGLASRRTHMVMGRTVTIASRLVEMTADLAHPILVGEGLAAQLAGEGLQSMGTFLLDGLRVPHHVYAYRLLDEAIVG